MKSFLRRLNKIWTDSKRIFECENTNTDFSVWGTESKNNEKCTKPHWPMGAIKLIHTHLMWVLQGEDKNGKYINIYMYIWINNGQRLQKLGEKY